MIAMRMLMLLMVMRRKHIHVVVRHGVLLLLLLVMVVLLLILHRCPRSSVRRDIHVEVVSCCIVVREVAHEDK